MPNLTLPAPSFVEGINSVIACADDDRTVPALNCVRVIWDAERVLFVATDRYTLAEQTIRREEAVGDVEGAVSIPLAAVKSALAVIKAGAVTDVAIEANGSHEQGSVAGVAFTEPSEFPRYEAVFPHPDTYSEVGQLAFDPALVAQLAGPKVKGRYAGLKFTFGSGPTKPVTVHRMRDNEVTGPTFRGLLMPIRTSGPAS